ncbi:MAG TPA: T9SS type A sorting domain-containing protein, partial [Bacteroidia bacterium]|nr:T9SS type A sorting domain-containing protein [Bacteroidia bacterium]
YAASTSRVLKWNAQSDGIIYTAQVATDSLFSNIVKAANLGTNQYNITGLSPLTKYFWRVKTNNGGHFSNCSDVWNFYVSAVGVENLDEDKNRVIVSPNPSKGTFTFEHVKEGQNISITDVNGRLVFNCIAEGNYVNINLENEPKGYYFYLIMEADLKSIKGTLIKE